jgi:hypothetical protein
MSQKEFSLTNQDIRKNTIFYVLPFTVLLSAPYLLFWGKNLYDNLVFLLITKFYLSLVFFLSGIILHEFIHGLTCAILGNACFKPVKFGICKNNLTPYCHYNKAIKLKYYLWALIMPAFLLGILPIILSWLTGIAAIFLFGFTFTILAAADLLMFIKLIKLDKNLLVIDLADKPGCKLVDEP